MAKTPILVIGAPSVGLKNVSLTDTENPYSYPSIAFELSAISSGKPPTSNHGTSIDYPKGGDYVRAVIAKFDQLITWANAGHTLIIVLDGLPHFSYKHSAGSSSTAKFSAADIPLIKSLSLSDLKGDEVKIIEKYKSLAGFLSDISYRYVISAVASLDPVFLAAAARQGNEKFIGGRVKVGNGRIFFVPPIIEKQQGERSRYYEAIGSFVESEVATQTAPKWAPGFSTLGEAELHSRIKQRREVIASMDAEIAVDSASITDMQRDKELFYASDNVFVGAVARSLSELGFEVVQGPPLRADLIAYDGASVFAIEAKGLEGAVKERDFRQALHWKAEIEATITAEEADLAANLDYELYADALKKLGIPLAQQELTTNCRAVVIICAYRLTPLDERIESEFPDSVAKVVARSHGTGISGLGLYELILSARKNPELKPELRKKFTIDGIVPQSAWQEFLVKITSGAT